MNSISTLKSGGNDITSQIDEIKSLLLSKTIRPLKKFRSLIIKRESFESRTNIHENLRLNSITRENNLTESSSSIKRSDLEKKKLCMISKSLKEFDILHKSLEIIKKWNFSSENESRDKPYSSTLSKENISVCSEIISSISNSGTPKEKININHQSSLQNDAIFNREFKRKNSHLIKSKFSESSNNNNLNKVNKLPIEKPFDVNKIKEKINEKDNFLYMDSSFDSYFDNFDENYESNHSIANKIEFNDTNVKEVESEFQDFIEIFEEFESNDKKEIKINKIKEEELKKKEDFKILDFENEICEDQSNNFEEMFNFTNKSTNINEYTFIKNISKGGYGIVSLYRKNNTGDDYIIKSVDIDFMVYLLIN